MFENDLRRIGLKGLSRQDIHSIMNNRMKIHSQLDESDQMTNQLYLSKLLSIDFNWDSYRQPYVN